MNLILKSSLIAFIVPALILPKFVFSQERNLLVQRPIWLELSSQEKIALQDNYLVQIIELDAFGMIIDNQGINESTSGTNIGSNLGGMVGNAVYVDKAINSGNYSAKSQLAAILVGGMLGSSLDTKGTAQYRFRYTIKLGTGNVNYIDEVKEEPYRHSIGVCVSIPNIALIDQQLCAQTLESIRIKYLTKNLGSLDSSSSDQKNAMSKVNIDDKLQITKPAKVNCKLGTQAPVLTTSEKCALIKGSVLE
jgi:hypothetical protein